MPPVRESSHHSLPAQPPFLTPPPPRFIVATLNDTSQRTSAPVAPPVQAAHVTNTAPQRMDSLTDLLNFVSDNCAILAVAWCAIGAAGVIEDPSTLPQLPEVGAGLVGALCAGVVVYIVLVLDREAERRWPEERLEGSWGRVWCWVRDLRGGTAGEVEVTSMFNDKGRSVFLLDESERRDPEVSMQECTPVGEASRIQAPLDCLPAIKSPKRTSDCPILHESRSHPHILSQLAKTSSSPRQYPISRPVNYESICQHSDLQHGADRATPRRPVRRSTSPPRNDHPSGLLGPSPVPTHYAVPSWKHFAGQGL